MERHETDDTRSRIARMALAVALALVAALSLRKGKRLTGALAGVGALALGATATSETPDLTETLEIETASEGDKLRCAACGRPIRPGERRRPNANHETVHDTCVDSAE
ncbi:DUF2892 domain-containing protein [Halorussus amylolyticus]|uniref:DUF2892 domain-containing protein n=1 Tax=Halorussus amylolyticus TaxID=1126242 RepID=UPI001050AB82|nr:DUF2892 domain-containing protein [Halorussus amylolyticus]